MVFLAFIAGVAGWCTHRYWMRLGNDKDPWRKRYWRWFFQGLLFPCLAWSAANIGWGDSLPALVPKLVDLQQTGEPWVGAWFAWSVRGAFLIGCYWSAVTYV